MPDEMFFSSDDRALMRGRRTNARTEACRPCLLTLPGGGEIPAVILNLNAHGLLVRLMEPVPTGTLVTIQMMRDESFSKPLSPPRRGRIVRQDSSDGTFHDVAIRLDPDRVPRRRERAPRASRTPPAITPREPSRMQTLDITLGGARRGRRR
jgi:hypothetical protein